MLSLRTGAGVQCPEYMDGEQQGPMNGNWGLFLRKERMDPEEAKSSLLS